jgi:hypothetical protein
MRFRHDPESGLLIPRERRIAETSPRACSASMQQALLSASGAAATDPNTVLLMHFNGSNGDTTTSDSSTAAHTFSQQNSATLSSTQKKFGATSADTSSGKAWETADSADWAFGSGKFTIECWVYFTSAPGTYVSFVSQMDYLASKLGWMLGFWTSQFSFGLSTNALDWRLTQASWSPTLNTWYQVAVDRDVSNVIRIYVDGTVKANTTDSSTLVDSDRKLVVGGTAGNWSTIYGPVGYIDEVRVSKGVSRYAGAFTAPSAEFSP